MNRRNVLTAAVIGAAMMASATAHAAVVTIRTHLNGPTEVPAVSSPATGTATVRVNTRTRKVTWIVTYKGLSGMPTAAHIHGPATRGTNAGVEVPIPVSPSPIKGSATITAAQLADLLHNRTYINIHTAAHPGGEIRGYLIR